ncbi:hypothetical protein EON65_27760 [archaeon]|nr:MAG: hypothetical protein EON65_27760 [archaeon]
MYRYHSSRATSAQSKELYQPAINMVHSRRKSSADDGLPYLQALDVTMKLSLAPYMTADPVNAIKSHVDKLLFRFDDQLGGIPLAYEDVTFVDGKGLGRIYADHPWVFVEARVTKLLTFIPQVGMTVRGKVSQVLHIFIPLAINILYSNLIIDNLQVSDNHVSLLVLGLFNASIGEAELRKRFSYNTVSNSW